MTDVPSKLQKTVQYLKDGAVIRPHAIGRKHCFRVVDKKMNPVLNITEHQLKKLKLQDIVKKEKGVFVFQKKSERRGDVRKFAVSFVGHGKWYWMEADTLGRAKYAFWKIIVQQKPSIQYKDTRGRDPEAKKQPHALQNRKGNSAVQVAG